MPSDGPEPEAEPEEQHQPAFEPEGFVAETSEASRRRPPAALYVVYMVLALGIIAGLVYLVYSAFQTEPIPPLESARHLVAAIPFAVRRSCIRWRE